MQKFVILFFLCNDCCLIWAVIYKKNGILICTYFLLKYVTCSYKNCFGILSFYLSNICWKDFHLDHPRTILSLKPNRIEPIWTFLWKTDFSKILHRIYWMDGTKGSPTIEWILVPFIILSWWPVDTFLLKFCSGALFL